MRLLTALGRPAGERTVPAEEGAFFSLDGQPAVSTLGLERINNEGTHGAPLTDVLGMREICSTAEKFEVILFTGIDHERIGRSTSKQPTPRTHFLDCIRRRSARMDGQEFRAMIGWRLHPLTGFRQSRLQRLNQPGGAYSNRLEDQMKGVFPSPLHNRPRGLLTAPARESLKTGVRQDRSFNRGYGVPGKNAVRWNVQG